MLIGIVREWVSLLIYFSYKQMYTLKITKKDLFMDIKTFFSCVSILVIIPAKLQHEYCCLGWDNSTSRA
jgi:hypothetical protein